MIPQAGAATGSATQAGAGSGSATQAGAATGSANAPYHPGARKQVACQSTRPVGSPFGWVHRSGGLATRLALSVARKNRLQLGVSMPRSLAVLLGVYVALYAWVYSVVGFGF